MPKLTINRETFLEDRQGRTFADVADVGDDLFETILSFFSDADRQRRMEESELHHDRAPLAGVVRELESLPAVHEAFLKGNSTRSKRLRQAIGVLVRMIMEGRGWQKTGRKGSLGVRAAASPNTPNHNSGGLALFFLRAERYELPDGMPYRTVKQRSGKMGSAKSDPAKKGRMKRPGMNGRRTRRQK